MRTHPERLRSVIIDAAVPFSVDSSARAPDSVDRAFKQLFDGCSDDPACDEAYPDLESMFYDLVDAYDETPIRVHFDKPEAVEIEVTGKTLVWTLYQHLYLGQTIPFLPMFIYALEDGGHDLITTFGLTAILSTPTNGMSYSVRCAEETFSDTEASDYPGIHPQISTLMIEYLNNQEACKIWDVESIGEFQPVESDIPTLILSGEFDPITPPEFGNILAGTLSSSHTFTFPGMGHGAFTKHPCPNSIVMDFLEDPSTTPDATCIDDMDTIFTVPAQGGEVAMEPFTDESAGMQAVRPAGWTEVGPGVYMLISEDDDVPTLFEQVRLPDQPLEYQIASWLPTYGIEAFPESIGQPKYNGLTWDLYHFPANMPSLGEMLVDVAIAEHDGRYYFIGLYAPPEKYDDMHEWVFIPALEGLRAYP
jgi:pimeloyl-ACP methyl ester carboxylesterase